MRRVATAVVDGLLAFVALGLCTWFLLHSSAAASGIQSFLDAGRPGPITFDRVELGPGWGQFTIYGLVVRDRSSTPQLRASRAFVDVDMSVFDRGKTQFKMIVRRLEVDDFDLDLVWNRFGKLKLSEGFGTRAMNVAREEPPPPKPVTFALEEIVLRRGDLDLAWEKAGFGFRFHQVSGTGTMAIKDKEFSLHVARLGSEYGTTWIRTDSEEVKQRLSAMPSNALSEKTDGAKIPYDSVVFENFKWEKKGFSTKLTIDATGGAMLVAEGKMAFAEDEPPLHELAFDITVPNPLLTSFSGGAAEGDARLKLTTAGVGVDAEVTVKELALDRVAVGKLSLQRPEIRALAVDGRESAMKVSLDARAEQVTWDVLSIDTPSVVTESRVTWPGLSVSELLKNKDGLPPIAGLLNAKARFFLKKLAAKRVSWARRVYEKIAVTGFAFEANMPKLTGNIDRVEAGEYGSLKGTALGAVNLGFTGVDVPMTITLDVSAVPKKVLEMVPRGDTVVLPDDAFTGRVSLTVKLNEPGSLIIETIEAR